MTENFYDRMIEQDLRWIKDKEGAFGLWIDALWPNHLNATFDEKKETFLYLLKFLLDDGKVFLAQPADDDHGERRVINAHVWAASNEFMIEYIRKYWPKDVNDDNDVRLTDFWYDIHCPRILWLDEEENVLIQS